MAAWPTSDLEAYEILRDRVESVLNSLREARSVEFKQSAPWNSLKNKIARTALAMCNLRDGGLILIGIAEVDHRWECTGISPPDLKTYDPDDMLDCVNKYASPAIGFDGVKHTDSSGRDYLAISIREFEQQPVVCKRSFPDELRRGAFYIRPVGKPESREVRSSEEMQEVLDMAVEKRMRHFVQQGRRIGIDMGASSVAESDLARFEEELGAL